MFQNQADFFVPNLLAPSWLIKHTLQLKKKHSVTLTEKQRKKIY